MNSSNTRVHPFLQQCPVRHQNLQHYSVKKSALGSVAQSGLKSWYHKTARWLRSVYKGLSNFETFFCDGHNKEVLFKYLVKCTSVLQLDDKMIVSTSDDVLSSRNHKHLITTTMQIQNCSFVCHAVQDGNDRAMICSTDTYVLVPMQGCGLIWVQEYPSPLSVFQSRPRSKQGNNIFLYIPWVWYDLLF